MGTVAFYRGRIMTPEQVLSGSALLVKDGRISGFVSENEIPVEYEKVSLADSWLLPGFIDVHVHGGGGADAMDGTVDAIRTLANFHLQHGTTALYPTTVTHNRGMLNRVIDAVEKAMQEPDLKRIVLGVHLEGPYLSEARKGAQAGDFIRLPLEEEYAAFFDSPAVKLMTVAPEVDGVKEMIRYGIGKGIRFSAGHSEAEYDIGTLSTTWGMSQVTHLYNAMTGLDRRAPGLSAAALVSKELRAQLICDGVHVHPAMVKLAMKAKGSDGVLLITDSLKGTGEDIEEFYMGNQKVVSGSNAFYLEDGTIAGSKLTMVQAVRNAVKLGGVALQVAVKMATQTPALAMGIESTKGSLTPGRDADLVVLDDRLELKQVWSMGRKCL